MVCCFDYNALVVCITYCGSFVVGKAKDSFDWIDSFGSIVTFDLCTFVAVVGIRRPHTYFTMPNHLVLLKNLAFEMKSWTQWLMTVGLLADFLSFFVVFAIGQIVVVVSRALRPNTAAAIIARPSSAPDISAAAAAASMPSFAGTGWTVITAAIWIIIAIVTSTIVVVRLIEDHR